MGEEQERFKQWSGLRWLSFRIKLNCKKEEREKEYKFLEEYEVEKYLVNCIKNFYECYKSCVRGEKEVREYFKVKRGMKQRCVMWLWLFKVFVNAVVKEVNKHKGMSRVSGIKRE